MAGRQIDGFEKINRLCHSLADFAHAGWANGSPGTCQNQEQLRGSWPIGTFLRIYQVRDRSIEARLWRSSIFSSLWPIGREYELQPAVGQFSVKGHPKPEGLQEMHNDFGESKVFVRSRQLVNGF
jgi:hypothetical protein